MRDLSAIVAALIAVTFPIHAIWGSRLIGSQEDGWKKWIRVSVVLFHFLCGCCSLLIIVAWLGGRSTIKAHQSEAKHNLKGIYTAQLAYFAKTNTYAGGPNAFQLINWEPAGQTRYAYHCQRAMIPNKIPPDYNYPTPERDWPVLLKPHGSRIGFTCMAIGNDDSDAKLDVWSINDAGKLVNEEDDVIDLW